MYDTPKIFNNYCYTQSKDLLIDIPSEHFSGLLHTSIHPVPPDISEYIQSAIEWDPRWSYSIFHTFDMAQNDVIASYQYAFHLLFLLIIAR